MSDIFFYCESALKRHEKDMVLLVMSKCVDSQYGFNLLTAFAGNAERVRLLLDQGKVSLFYFVNVIKHSCSTWHSLVSK